MESRLPAMRRTQLAPRQECAPPISTRQLEFVIDDVRLRGLTPVQRQAALRTLAHLLPEASGIAKQEAGDDHL